VVLCHSAQVSGHAASLAVHPRKFPLRCSKISAVVWLWTAIVAFPRKCQVLRMVKPRLCQPIFGFEPGLVICGERIPLRVTSVTIGSSWKHRAGAPLSFQSALPANVAVLKKTRPAPNSSPHADLCAQPASFRSRNPLTSVAPSVHFHSTSLASREMRRQPFADKAGTSRTLAVRQRNPAFPGRIGND